MTEQSSTPTSEKPNLSLVTFDDVAGRLQGYCVTYGVIVLVLYVLRFTVIGDFLHAQCGWDIAWVNFFQTRPVISFNIVLFIVLLVFASPLASLGWATDRRLRLRDANERPLNAKYDHELLKSFIARVPTQSGVLFMLVVIWATSSNLFSKYYNYQAVVEVLVLSAVTLLFPMLAFLARAGVERIYAKVKRRGTGVLSTLVAGMTRLTRDVLPYIGVQLAFLSFWAFVCLRPDGPGSFLTNWIWASMRDANVEQTKLSTMVWGPVLPGWAPFELTSAIVTLVISIILFFAAISILSPYAVRAGLTYRSFLNRYFERSSSAVEALTDVLATPSRIVSFRKEVSWMSDYFQSIVWIVLCYVVLFSSIAICSEPHFGLARSVHDWLVTCARDVNIPREVAENPKLMIFMASIVAAYGSAHLAVTACVFLPNRKRRRLRVNKDGIADEVNFFGYLMRVPWRSWSDLKSVSVKGKRRRLVFKFRIGGTLVVNLKDLSDDDCKVLLSIADERANVCRFDAESLAILKELQSLGGLSKAGQTGFDSTIFAIHKLNDTVCGGAYRIVKQISTRPLSAVYLARSGDDRLVVLKQFVTPDDSESSRKWTGDLKREYEMLKSFSHPQVAKVLSVTDDATTCYTYLALEYIDGENLRSLVNRQGERSQKTVQRWAIEIAQVMKYLHSLDPPIVHRDLTPDNIILGSRGDLKLVDFGAAHQFLEGVTGTLIGKQCYIAPEQLRGQIKLESDIYSFGCTLYFLLTGKDPQALSNSSPRSEGLDVDPQMNDLIKRCTKFDEAERIGSFDEILAVLNVRSAESAAVTSIVEPSVVASSVAAEPEQPASSIPASQVASESDKTEAVATPTTPTALAVVEVAVVKDTDGGESFVLNISEKKVEKEKVKAKRKKKVSKKKDA